MRAQTATTNHAAGKTAGVGGAPRSGGIVAIAQALDLLFVAIAVPVALAAGAPVFGCLVGALAWLLQRTMAAVDRRLIVKAAEPGSRLGLNFIDAFGRIWLLAGGIVAAGAIGGRRDGLSAALLIFGAYSVAFAVRLARGRSGGPG